MRRTTLILALLIVTSSAEARVRAFRGMACKEMSPANLFIDYRGASGCSPFNQQFCNVGESVTLTARAFFYDFGCSPHTIVWNLGDGTVATGQTVEKRWAQMGVYRISVTITNPRQRFEIASEIRVGAAVPATPFTTQPLTSSTYRFSVLTAGSDSWEWDFGDGSSMVVVDSPTIDHEFPRSGQYVVTLRSCAGGEPVSQIVDVTIP